eukprot:jgi/Tetstr1/443535/TSEL_031539.t1
MEDPGRQYLYSAPKDGSDARQRASGKAPAAAEGSSGSRGLPPRSPAHPPAAGSRDEGGSDRASLGRWDAALGNVADAGVALQQLKHALDDAIYLDEDAYNGVASLTHYTRTIQAQQRRILELEHELEAALGAVERSDSRARESERQRQEAEMRASSIEAELENNAVVFKMHYNELLAKTEEVQKLKAIIEGLSNQR